MQELTQFGHDSQLAGRHPMLHKSSRKIPGKPVLPMKNVKRPANAMAQYNLASSVCIRLASLRSIAGLPDKYGHWSELYRARPALVRFGIAATVPASTPPRQSSTAPFRLPVTHSLMKIFTGKTGLPSLARYFSGSLVQHGLLAIL